MELTFKKSEIISSSEISKNFSSCRDILKSNSKAIVFKNNQPELAILDINEYENLISAKETLAELLDDIAIIKMVEERSQHDNGKRWSLDELKEQLAFCTS